MLGSCCYQTNSNFILKNSYFWLAQKKSFGQKEWKLILMFQEKVD